MNKIYAFIYNVNNTTINPMLPNHIREHCNQYNIEEKRQISLSNYYYLSKRIEELYNRKIDDLSFTIKGKPIIDGLYVSLSHSKKYFGFAISNSENIGFDLEEIIEEKRLEISKRILTEEEKIELDKASNKVLYLTTKWCAKEAYGKSLGTGLNNITLNTRIENYYTKRINDTILVITSNSNDIDIYLDDVLMD